MTAADKPRDRAHAFVPSTRPGYEHTCSVSCCGALEHDEEHTGGDGIDGHRPDKPRADLVALLLQFEAAADHRGSLYLSGDDAGAAVRAWCDLRGHRLEIGTLTRVTDGKTVAWTHYTVEDTGDLPRWTVTCALHDDHEVTAQADQQVLARVQAALDGEQPDERSVP